MKTIVGFVLSVAVMVFVVASGLTVGAPPAHADCANGAISPPTEYGTYSVCVGGQWQYVDRELCVDHPESQYCTSAETPTSSSAASPAPVAPAPVAVAPPPVDTPNLPYLPFPNVSVPSPNIGCTYVNGYTRKNGTHVSGYYRC